MAGGEAEETAADRDLLGGRCALHVVQSRPDIAPLEGRPRSGKQGPWWTPGSGDALFAGFIRALCLFYPEREENIH